MPAYIFKSPDGKTYTVNAPDGVSEGEAFQMLSQQLGQQQATPAPDQLDPNWRAGLPAAPGATGGPSGDGSGLPPVSVDDPARRGREEVVDDMSWLQKFGAGAGQSVDSSIRGVRQLLNMGIGDEEAVKRLQQEEADARVADEALLDSGWGRTGQIAGHLAQLAIPAGYLSKGAKALTAGMPRAAQVASVLGAESALGGAYGSMQPTVEGESHGKNAAIGGALGAGSRLAPWAVGAGARILGEKSGVSPALRIAASALRNASKGAGDPAASSVRQAAGTRIGEITSGVRVPLKPIAGELAAIERSYGRSLPGPVRDQLTALADWGKRYGGQLKGDKLQEMRTALHREATKKEGMTQSGLERIARVLDEAVENQLSASRLRALRQARTEYRTGLAQPGVRFTAPATVAGGTGLFLSPGPE